MAKFKFTKQGYEKFPIEADFSNRIDVAGGETIVSQTVIAETVSGTDATSDVTLNAQNDGSACVLVYVRNGAEADSPYKITFRCTTSLGNDFETDVFMKIKEI